MLGSAAMATDYDYEVTPLIGYNIAEGDIDLKDYAIFGGEFQYNGLDSIIKPELSLLYSKADYESPSTKDTNVWRVALNGLYEYDKVGSVIPLAKAGIGYENMSDNYTTTTGNANSVFVDAGVGAKISFTDNIALKLEAVYMLKHNNARYDSNLAILAGLNIAFGAKSVPAVAAAAVVAAAVVDGDDDNDGVLNSMDKCPTTAAGVAVDADGCKMDGDDDKDGVLNSMDKCPTTEAGTTVDADGCKVDGDDDKDGVLNSKDICPNTPAGDAVNSDGCSKTVNLNVNFENDSYEIKGDAVPDIDNYANFLTTYTNYSAKIIGYTDSRGSASHNQKLSENRANAVKQMLQDKGVNANQLSSAGMGESNFVADNATKEGRAQNRRIEAELTKN